MQTKLQTRIKKRKLQRFSIKKYEINRAFNCNFLQPKIRTEKYYYKLAAAERFPFVVIVTSTAQDMIISRSATLKTETYPRFFLFSFEVTRRCPCV